MKEHPILFSKPMVQAILDGRKTQTRRIVKGLKRGYEPEECLVHTPPCLKINSKWEACPYEIGDRLWVRETATYEYVDLPKDRMIMVRYQTTDGLRRRVQVDEEAFKKFKKDHQKKIPSIFMPRWASRLLLEITDIRAQLLQEITDEDCRAEGLSMFGEIQPPSIYEGDVCLRDKDPVNASSPELRDWQEGFKTLWNSINKRTGRNSWNANPLVRAITFKRVE